MKPYLMAMALLAGCASMPDINCPRSSYAAFWACQRPQAVSAASDWRPSTSHRGAQWLARGDLLLMQVKAGEVSNTEAQQRLLDYTNALESQRLQGIAAFGAIQPHSVRIIP